MIWLNEPARSSENERCSRNLTGRSYDFWRITDYGFIHDNGHARLEPVEGDFTASVAITADYRAQFDQAGLMIRVELGKLAQNGDRICRRSLFSQRRRHARVFRLVSRSARPLPGNTGSARAPDWRFGHDRNRDRP